MKKLLLLLSFSTIIFAGAKAQDANVSLSNLSNNNGYTDYNTGTQTISGIYFEVLSDGTNSNFVISDFKVSLYLIPCDGNGNPTGTSESDLTLIKEYSVSNMHQFGSIDYSNESVDLNQVSSLTTGNYRLGVWVNSDLGVPQPPDDGSDNASVVTLNSNGNDYESIISYTQGATAVKNSLQDLGIVIPNPLSSDQLHNIIIANDFDSVEIYDAIGQKQNANALSSGVYVTRFSKNNKLYTGKIIVK